MTTTATTPARIEDLKKDTPAKREQPRDFPAMLTMWLPEIKRALPRHMNGDRMARIALTAFRQNPRLGECDPRGVFACVIQSSQLGLEIGMRGRAYLVPYKNNRAPQGAPEYECQFVPGWMGLVDLLNRTGRATAWTGAVFDGDTFDYELGDRPFVKHKPHGEDDPKKLMFVYAVGRVNGAEHPIIEVWPISKVWRHRDRYNKVGKRHYSYENPEMYARKVPLLQVLKYLPSSPELDAAVALNDAAEIGSQGLSVKDAIEGTWAPVADTPNEGASGDTPPLSVDDVLKMVDEGDFDSALDLARSFDEPDAERIRNAVKGKQAAQQAAQSK